MTLSGTVSAAVLLKAPPVVVAMAKDEECYFEIEKFISTDFLFNSNETSSANDAGADDCSNAVLGTELLQPLKMSLQQYKAIQELDEHLALNDFVELDSYNQNHHLRLHHPHGQYVFDEPLNLSSSTSSSVNSVDWNQLTLAPSPNNQISPLLAAFTPVSSLATSDLDEESGALMNLKKKRNLSGDSLNQKRVKSK